MLILCRVTKVKVLFLVLVYVFNVKLFEFSAAILEKGLFYRLERVGRCQKVKLPNIIQMNLSGIERQPTLDP